MIRTTLQISAQFESNSARFTNKVNRVIDGMATVAVIKTRPFMDAKLNAYPGQVKRPIQWASDRQRKAFFASKGFGRGIPTQRSGKSISWIYAYRDGTIILQNNTPYAQFIWGGFGTRNLQQPFHRNTGYPRALTVRDSLFKQVDAIMREGFTDALEKFGVLTTGVTNR